MPELFTRKELADKLKCHPRTIDNLRAKGMPHLMVGDSPRFELEPVKRWLEARGAVEPLEFEGA